MPLSQSCCGDQLKVTMQLVWNETPHMSASVQFSFLSLHFLIFFFLFNFSFKLEVSFFAGSPVLVHINFCTSGHTDCYRHNANLVF